MISRQGLVMVGLFLTAASPHAQNIPSARVAILLAEERGALDARDLATLRAGIRNADGETARAAIRALGRLRRPALVADIAAALRSPFPELRAEAADAIGSAFAGLTSGFGATSSTIAGLTASPNVQAQIGSSSIVSSSSPSPTGDSDAASAVPSSAGSGANQPATPPRASGGRPVAATRAPTGATTATVTAVASALSTLLARLTVEIEPSVRAAISEALGRIPYTETTQILRAESALLNFAQSEFVTDRLGAVKGFESMIRMNVGRWSPSPATLAVLRELVGATTALPLRDARIRRLAFEALMTAGEVDSAVIERGATDPDPQVRWLTMRAAGMGSNFRADIVSSVLRAGLSDPQPIVRIEALRAIGTREKGSFAACRHFIRGVHDRTTQVSLVSIDLLGDCNMDPEAMGLLEYAANNLSSIETTRGWHRAAHALVALSRAVPDRARAVLGQFAASSISHVRAYGARAAVALNDRVTLEKLAADVDDEVAQVAAEGLASTTGRRSTGQVQQTPHETDLTATELQRLAAPKARVTIRGVGTFELALFTSHAPAAVLRFAKLAESGEFNGSPLGAVTPTIVSLIPQPKAGRGDGDPRPDETGSWPHVRGAVGLASGRSATGEAQIFIDLVDNPRLDHNYPVFAQVLNGLELIDQILEGDIVERIEIVAGP